MFDFVASSKDRMVNVRLTPLVHDQFKIACGLRGGSMSSILHQFIVRTIREEKELEPKAFDKVQTPESKPNTVTTGVLKTAPVKKLKQNKG